MIPEERPRKFTYGDQFSPKKFALKDLLELCVSSEGDRYALQNEIKNRYFRKNPKKMAMNCVLSLKGYGLIEINESGKNYTTTNLTENLLSVADNIDEIHRQFAVHILTKLEGLFLARIIEEIRSRGEEVTLEYLGEELNDKGIQISPSCTYISTMRSWLAKAGVFPPRGYKVNWDVIYDLLKVNEDFIDKLYRLDPKQKYFLLSLANLDARDFIPSSKVAEYARSIYKIRLTRKNLVKEILEPLEKLGIIETRKTTKGRGAKSHAIKLTERGISEILQPMIENLAELTKLSPLELNRKFESVVDDLESEDIHTKGIALELFAVWMTRLLGLRFVKWREKHQRETGGGEVDVIAASDRIVYNRWQIQCKNQISSVGVKVIAREIGMSFMTKANIIMVITTSHFSSNAINYAERVTDNSRYYIILVDNEDVKRIARNRESIIDILNTKAQRAFARRELAEHVYDTDGEADILPSQELQ